MGLGMALGYVLGWSWGMVLGYVLEACLERAPVREGSLKGKFPEGSTDRPARVQYPTWQPTRITRPAHPPSQGIQDP